MRRFMRILGLVTLRLLLVTAVLLFLCEFALYPLVIRRCSWPPDDELAGDGSVPVLKALFIADTHLLGPIKGHWFDKLRREWQMHRAFVTAVDYFRPEVVFFLGDIFDEGEWVSQPYFDRYVARFASLFPVPSDTEVYVIPGNHDMGFHSRVHPVTNSRFQKAFNSTSVKVARLKGVNFVLINSMAVEMDGCFLCKDGLTQLNEVEDVLGCQKKQASKCSNIKDKKKAQIIQGEEYSPPIILQHFPMYRKSDELCDGDDAAPLEERMIPFRPSYDCLSKDSTSVLLHSLQPRLILSGHTHHFCERNHTVNDALVPEVSVPSFSWRNRNNPSFFLGVFTKNKYLLSKCYMPRESTVKVIYAAGLCTYAYILLPIFVKIVNFLSRSLRRRTYL